VAIRARRQQVSAIPQASADDRGSAVEAKADGPISGAETGALNEEAIRRRAYELYESRHGQPGDALGDWYQAENELRKLSAI
jgi:hypothetical protein